MPLRWAGCLCLALAGSGRRGGAKSEGMRGVQAGAPRDAGVAALKGSGLPLGLASRAQVSLNSPVSTCGVFEVPFRRFRRLFDVPREGRALLVMPRYCCGGALVRCRPDCLSKAAKGRL
jgi:hypothetical protein